MRQLVIGDIHGCFAELEALLDAAGLCADDEIIALGDILDRGPSSLDTFEFFATHRHARSLLGNHERKHIRSYRRELRPALSQVITRAEIGEARYPEVVRMLDTWPRLVELRGALLVHGFVIPELPLMDQPETVLVGTLTGEERVRRADGRPWYERYRGPELLIVGHHDYLGTGQPLIVPRSSEPRVIGLDTSCCHGRALTGIVLPDMRFVSVRSRRNYWAEHKNTHAELESDEAALTLEQTDALVAKLASEPELAPTAAERLGRLRAYQQEADEFCDWLLALATEEHERIVAKLAALPRLEPCGVSEQARRYSELIDNRALAPMLHAARKGRLSRESLRASLTDRAQLQRLAKRLREPHDRAPVSGQHETATGPRRETS